MVIYDYSLPSYAVDPHYKRPISLLYYSICKTHWAGLTCKIYENSLLGLISTCINFIIMNINSSRLRLDQDKAPSAPAAARFCLLCSSCVSDQHNKRG